MINESHERSIVKGISWRIIATTDTFLVVFVITCLVDQCSVENALKIGVIEFFIKLLIYYTHERVWLQFIKSFTFSKQQSLSRSSSQLAGQIPSTSPHDSSLSSSSPTNNLLSISK